MRAVTDEIYLTDEVSIIYKILHKTVCKRAVTIFFFAVIITLLASVITYIVNPDLKEVMQSIEEKTPDQLKESSGIHMVWAYIVNNGFKVPLQMFVLALIPIPFLYLINIISTALLPGIVFGVVLQLDIGKGMELITSTLPHYFTEVFAFCLFAAVLFELNRVVRVKVRNVFKKDIEEISLTKKTLKTIKGYAVFVLPLIIIAAFLETYVADLILNVFQ